MVRRSLTVLRVELSEGGCDVPESACGFLHGGLFTKNNKAGIAVSLNVEMPTEAVECGVDFFNQLKGLGMMLSTPESWRAGAQSY